MSESRYASDVREANAIAPAQNHVFDSIMGLRLKKLELRSRFEIHQPTVHGAKSWTTQFNWGRETAASLFRSRRIGLQQCLTIL
jgi:hypothetical protein